ncbi:Ig-like domain-containing protein [Butyrivibrio sp. AE2015]|uniref:Ig-like domain-containing protein n=1 Tax=Butyrivibrio sp. AE2015 TaxID=1280663 RepID=UPI0003B352C1|nr:leucine-rich repeat protein [Butyrivibrio sp. AE2015]
MKRNQKLWSWALAGALAVSNLSGVVAVPFTTIVAKAAEVSLGSWTLPTEGADRKLDLESLKSDTTLTFKTTSVDSDYGLDADTAKFYAIPTITVNGKSYEGAEIGFDYTKSASTITAAVAADTMKAYAAYGNGDASVSFQLYKKGTTDAADRQIPVGDPIVLTLETNKVASIELDTSAAKENIGLTDSTGFTVKAKSAKNDDNSTYTVSGLSTVIMSDAELKTYTDALEAFDAQMDVIQGITIPVITSESNESEINAYKAALTKLNKETAKLGTLGNAVKATVDPTGHPTWTDGKVATSSATAGNYNVVFSDGVMTKAPFFGKYVVYPFEVINDSVALAVTSSKADTKTDAEKDTISSMKVGSTDQIKVKVAGQNATAEELAKFTWVSSQPTAVSVDADGKIEALKGTSTKTTITGTYKLADNVIKEVKFYVTAVADPVVALAYDDGTGAFATANTNVEKEIVVTVDGDEFTGNVEWKITKNGASTSDATISGRTFKATAAGTYDVTATAEVISGYKVAMKAAQSVNVTDPTAVVTFKNQAGKYVSYNTNLQTTYGKKYLNTGDVINAVIKVGNTNVTSDYTWKSYNEDIATVENGVITIVGEGTTNIGYKLGTGKEELLSLTAKDDYAVVYELNGDVVTAVYPNDVVDLKLYKGNTEITSGVTWEVENITYASVSGSKLTGKKAGKTTLNAYLDGVDDPVFTNAAFEVKAATVSFVGNAITVADGSNANMVVGESRSFVAKSGNNEISGTWSVSTTAKTAGITVSSDGIVKVASSTTADTYPNAVIFKYDGTNYGFGLVVAAKSISVTTADGTTTIAKGKSIQLIAKNGSEDITSNKAITFRVTAGDTHISVDENSGIVTGLSQGSGTVTVYEDGVATTATITIKVTNSNKATAIILNKSTLSLDLEGTEQLTATTNPSASSDTVIWSSSDEAVVTVNDGLVTAVGEGTAVITASVGRDDEVSPATCTVTVTKSDEQKAEEEKQAEEEKKQEEQKQQEQKAAEEKAAAQKEGATGTDATANANFTVTSTANKTVAYTAPATKAKKVTVPSTVTVGGEQFAVTEIAKNAFKGDKTVTTITIPASIKKINSNAFKNAKNLKTIKIQGAKLEKVSKNAFNGIKKNAKIKVSGANKRANKKLLKKTTAVKKGNVKVK